MNASFVPRAANGKNQVNELQKERVGSMGMGWDYINLIETRSAQMQPLGLPSPAIKAAFLAGRFGKSL